MRLIRCADGRARTFVALALVVAVGLGVVGAGFASRRSQSVRASTLGATQFPGYPSVAADGSLGFDAVWADRAIVTAHWSASTGVWTRAVELPGWIPGQWEPQVAGSPSGAAAIVWTQGSFNAPQDVEASYRPAGINTWPPPVRIFSTSSHSVSEIPQVGMDDHGDAFAAWATSRALYVAEHPAHASSWSTHIAVAHAGLKAFAVSPDGAAVAVWERSLSGGPSTATKDLLYVSVKPPGQTSWSRPLDLGRSGYYPLQGDAWIFQPQPRVAINAHGTVFVVWQWPRKSDFYPRVAILTAADDWRKPTSVALPEPGTDPVIAGDDRGASTVLWNVSNGREGIEQADLSPGGRVLATRALGPGGDARLVSDGNGDLAGVWSNAAVRPAEQAKWCPKIKLNAAEDDWAVAIAPDGVGQVLWEHWPGGQHGNVILARTMRPCTAG